MYIYAYTLCVWFNKEVACGDVQVFSVSECIWVTVSWKTPNKNSLYTCTRIERHVLRFRHGDGNLTTPTSYLMSALCPFSLLLPSHHTHT